MPTEPERVDPETTAASGNESEATDTGEADTEASEATDDSSESEDASSEHFAVGETVKMGDVQFTVNSAHWDTGGEFAQPDPGTQWLLIDATLENTSSESAQISSMLMFKLMDEQGYSRDMSLIADTKGSLDGELGADQMMRGQLAYVVDEGQTQWELIFEPNVFGSGQARYVITADQVQ
ncbi:MAG TPA: DUF4352 domain-containing protein [Thermoleophilia bacterium]|nr:DUF4352 domain-containing protein [Thermoleophilia bacterium]